MHSENVFQLDHDIFANNLKCARRGAAGGVSGMTAEHLKPIADNPRDMGRFCEVGELMARGQIPQEILQVIRMERMTALKKKTGGVRGIAAGDIVRRLVAKTISRQIRV